MRRGSPLLRPVVSSSACVFDASPRELTPEALTLIYGEEDWQATIQRDGEEESDGEADASAAPASGRVVL